jgi:eukaryotic-like serine/threonine-protein kinase
VDLLPRLRAALADRYTIERELGRGGMAIVYLGRDLRHDRFVALKVLHAELAATLGPERFQREIKVAARLQHPHILTVLDSGDAAEQLWYTMPFVEGESLRERLTRERQLPLDDALQITQEVADALGYAHNQGIVHRDIKPENILLSQGHALVADFGVARALQSVGERLTETGMAVGTPAYMSPEQATAERQVDARSDLYSLGCVLYEMLAGEPPYTGPSAQAVIAKRFSEPIPHIRTVRESVPEAIEQVVTKTLAKTPADRYGSAAQLAAALELACKAPVHVATQFAEALTASSTIRPSEAVPAKPRARRVAVLLAGLLVVGGGLGILHETGVLWPSGSPSGSRRVTSLVVLPLVNLSGDTAQEYFADGMTEALITELGKVSALTVISRTSAMFYKGSHKPLPEIARELGVQDVVEASVLREGGQVRISARLIDGRTDRRLWESTYDREATRILALQAEVARTIAGAVGAALTPAETRRLPLSRRVDAQAYDEFLRGRHDFALGTADGLKQAIPHYRRAIALDSTFVDPHADLVEVYSALAGIGVMSPKESTPLATSEAVRAVALDSGSAGAHFALAVVRLSFEWRWGEADREFRRALELNPGVSDVHVWYSVLLTGVGRLDEAEQHALRAVALDPRQVIWRAQLGQVYSIAGRFQEAIVAIMKARELDPAAYWPFGALALNYSALGRHKEAIEAVSRALQGDSENQITLQAAVTVYARAGRPAVARRFLDSYLALGRKGRWVDSYGVACAYAWLGETDQALAYFRRAIDERSPNVGILKMDFLPQTLKGDPRYHALVRRIGLE